MSLMNKFLSRAKARTIPAVAQDKTLDYQFDGFTENRSESKYLELLPDECLKELNTLLDWNCYTIDPKGRRFGKPNSPHKRVSPQKIPDHRILEMDKRFDLIDKTVLEVGCFEGVHTTALCRLAKKVIAIDSRMENIVKTMVRTSFYDCHPSVLRIDLESISTAERSIIKADILHHVGVLYHLAKPVEHLLDLPNFISKGIMLDTHIAEPDQINGEYEVNGKKYNYYHYKEGTYQNVFAGMKDHAKWLLLDDIVHILKSVGFEKVEVVEIRKERNGSRVLLFAEKTGG